MFTNKNLNNGLNYIAIGIVFIIIGVFMFYSINRIESRFKTPEYPNIEKTDIFTTINLDYFNKAVCLNSKQTVCTCYRRTNRVWTEKECPKLIIEYQNAK